MILNEGETFGFPRNRIGLPLFEVDQETPYDLPNEWSGVATQRGLLQILLC
jgi:hypothetical protein